MDVTSQKQRFATNLGRYGSRLRSGNKLLEQIQYELDTRRGCRYTPCFHILRLQIALVLVEVGYDSLERVVWCVKSIDH
jgi:hypothetical protein